MKNSVLLIIIILIMSSCRSNKNEDKNSPNKPVSEAKAVNNGNVDFSNYFAPKTMRLDFYHTGNNSEEIFAVDNILSDGQWSGSKNILIDKLEFGPYFFEVIDKESNVLLYSRGFASIFGEWQLTPEAQQGWGTFHESLRFPWPLKPVAVIVKKRNTENKFVQIWNTDVDPASRLVNKADKIHNEKTFVISGNDDVNGKLDIVILGDGYTAAEMEKFRNDATRLSNALLSAEPFNSLRDKINIRGVETPAEISGLNKPHQGVFKRSPLSVSYGIFDSERYALSYDNKTIRDVASAVPYDFMVILMNEKTYGGGGIYNLYTTVAADNMFSDYIMIHEMGHHLAALADEYYTSSVSYEAPAITLEPWEPNVTALLDKGNLKWKDLVGEGTPLPTPWNKDVFDSYGYDIQKERKAIRAKNLPESVIEELFVRQKSKEEELLSTEKYKGKVGAFEGANYNSKGMYRSELNCIMYTRYNVFCRVCQRSITDVIRQYTE
ncbi:MAG: hypothetical protein KA807_00345 [Prolixibacteraceae bacterium]|nr:hypothetical protein [Prolixibacteraceae bacterium]